MMTLPYNNKQGTALLVALLVMGVLLAVSLVLSGLIFREIRITKDLVDAGRAHYAAESGIEMALLKLDNNLPGWETPDKGYLPMNIGNDTDFLAVSEFKVDNTCNAYPCFDSDYDTSSLPVDKFYDVLDLNESITIPLFVVKEDPATGAVEEIPVKNFTVEFFTAFDPQKDLKVIGPNLHGWDILRWKIFGLHGTKDNPGTGATETISDFTAVSTLQQISASADSVDFGMVPEAPSWLGTVNCSEFANGQGDIGRYYPGIECISYASKDIETVNLGKEAKYHIGVCDNTEAREYYWYQGDNDLDVDEIQSCYPIKNFLNEHKLNYLTLTNLMNPSVLDTTDPIKKRELSKLYFRVELFGDEQNPTLNNQTVREYAILKANGYSGNAQQSIEARIRRGSFMPVFNFSLYSTYKGEKGSDYYYAPEE